MEGDSCEAGDLYLTTALQSPVSPMLDSDDSEDMVPAVYTSPDADHIARKLASTGTTGLAAASAITSMNMKRRASHVFQTNPSLRRRQQTRLIRKMKALVEEYSIRIGQQVAMVAAVPGKSSSFKCFGSAPLDAVLHRHQASILSDLEDAIAPSHTSDTTGQGVGSHDLPPVTCDGLPVRVEEMTQCQLRGFIPTMIKYSTGRGKPGWGKEECKPPWWPACVLWANVRSDTRSEEEREKLSWSDALRRVVKCCYSYHQREDMLPDFSGAAGAGVSGDSPHTQASTEVLPADTLLPPQAPSSISRGGGTSDSSSSSGAIILNHCGDHYQLIPLHWVDERTPPI